jgi:hypothetical protein
MKVIQRIQRDWMPKWFIWLHAVGDLFGTLALLVENVLNILIVPFGYNANFGLKVLSWWLDVMGAIAQRAGLHDASIYDEENDLREEA